MLELQTRNDANETNYGRIGSDAHEVNYDWIGRYPERAQKRNESVAGG